MVRKEKRRRKKEEQNMSYCQLTFCLKNKPQHTDTPNEQKYATRPHLCSLEYEIKKCSCFGGRLAIYKKQMFFKFCVC